ncbi:hypothetical protein GS8_2596 [Geobacillus stearothermophilus]|uniref:Uncharacterized protein n=1 Tax=Geobacillus stearothermophilus TaxID=1422 RepID=A0ABQ7HE31_GEOSE|nr:hypothetical protein GS8_2596 [Geobacillus stearothermophilus]
MDFDHPLSPLLRDQHLVYIYGDNQLFRLKKRKTSNVSRLQGCGGRSAQTFATGSFAKMLRSLAAGGECILSAPAQKNGAPLRQGTP